MNQNQQRRMLTENKKDTTLNVEDIVPYYWFDKCRICLKPGEIAIFSENDVLSKIVEFGSITISEQDNYPKHLCETCNLLLEAAVLFRRTAEKTDYLLRNPNSKAFIDNSDSLQYLKVVNKLLDNKYYLSDLRSKYLSNIYYETKHEFKHSQKLQKTEDSVSDDNSSIIDVGTEKEYLIVNESDIENETRNAECDITKCDTFMLIVSDEVDHGNKGKDDYFTCDICLSSFHSIGVLENHIELEHNIKKIDKVQCTVCNEVMSKVIYKYHMEYHREKYKQKKKTIYKIECKVCNKIINKSYYKIHMKMHGTEDEKAERVRLCFVCNKHISNTYYNDHLKHIHKVGSFGEPLKDYFDCRKQKHVPCPVCDRNIRKNKYNEHLARHGKPPRKYVCEHCAREFIYPSAFKTHCLTHGGELKYSCQFCPYKAQHLALLKVHVRTHTGDYNYPCPKCPAKFLTKSNLNQHVLRHNGPGHIKCYECDKTFYRARNMEEHYKTKHLGIRDVLCQICGKGFSHRDRMLSHQIKVHNRKRLLSRLPTYLKVASEQKNS